MNRTAHKTTIQLLSIALVLLLSGSHWTLLQGVAWTTMLLDSERGSTISERAVNTFSGDNPCTLCLVIQDGLQKGQQDAEFTVCLDSLRITALMPKHSKVPSRYPETVSYPITTWLCPSTCAAAPPTPPPILA